MISLFANNYFIIYLYIFKIFNITLILSKYKFNDNDNDNDIILKMGLRIGPISISQITLSFLL